MHLEDTEDINRPFASLANSASTRISMYLDNTRVNIAFRTPKQEVASRQVYKSRCSSVG